MPASGTDTNRTAVGAPTAAGTSPKSPIERRDQVDVFATKLVTPYVDIEAEAE